jgi:hypothetical protein
MYWTGDICRQTIELTVLASMGIQNLEDGEWRVASTVQLTGFGRCLCLQVLSQLHVHFVHDVGSKPPTLLGADSLFHPMSRPFHPTSQTILVPIELDD